MAQNEDGRADLLRRFESAISGAELADLRQLVGDLTLMGAEMERSTPRPELRRARLDEVAILRVRVDLDHATPPIWRRLDLRSDLTLDVLHQVLQVAFGWTDSHLHRFSLGGRPFDPTSQLFLCPYDVEEAEVGDEGGIPAAEVRLDETLREPGEVLAYVYDYGDSWELTLRLEEVLPATPGAPSAVAVAGLRAAPPEDSGGAVDADSLALVLDDPAHLDLDEVNQALREPYFVLRENGVDQRLVDLLNRLRFTPRGDDLAARALTVITEPIRPEDPELVASLAPYQWFLDRAAAGGIALTSAGYLKPADVEAASEVVPAMADWIGKNNRESLAGPLLDFRQSLQKLGLLRKYKGTLLLTRAGAAARHDPGRVWDLLAGKLVPAGNGFDAVATLLVLAYAASSPGRVIPLDAVTDSLTHLGWWHRDGRAVGTWELYHLSAFDILTNVTDRPLRSGGAGRRISPAAAALARAALRR